MVNSIKSGAARYGTGTLGLILVAIGVALSIKSDLGTAPIHTWYHWPDPSISAPSQSEQSASTRCLCT